MDPPLVVWATQGDQGAEGPQWSLGAPLHSAPRGPWRPQRDVGRRGQKRRPRPSGAPKGTGGGAQRPQRSVGPQITLRPPEPLKAPEGLAGGAPLRRKEARGQSALGPGAQSALGPPGDHWGPLRPGPLGGPRGRPVALWGPQKAQGAECPPPSAFWGPKGPRGAECLWGPRDQ